MSLHYLFTILLHYTACLFRMQWFFDALKSAHLAFPLRSLRGRCRACATDEVFINCGDSRNIVHVGNRLACSACNGFRRSCRSGHRKNVSVQRSNATKKPCPFRLCQTKNKIQAKKDSLDLNIRAVFSAFNVKLVPAMRNRQACSLRQNCVCLTAKGLITPHPSRKRDTFPSSSARGRQGAPISVR